MAQVYADSVRTERLQPNQWEQAKEASLESSIVVKGVAKSEPRAPGGYEIHADHLKRFT